MKKKYAMHCRVLRRCHSPIYAAASAVLLFAACHRSHNSAGPLLRPLPDTVITADSAIIRSPFGNRFAFRLPDSTLVTLNANSTLSYPLSYNRSRRQVTLHGAAFFDVDSSSGKPFNVEIDNMLITTAGASFYVRAYPYEAGQEVQLLAGTLKAAKTYPSPDSVAAVAHAGEMVMLNRGIDLMETDTYDGDWLPGWKQNRLDFDHAGCNQVVSRLEKWFGVVIEVKGDPGDQVRFSGRYRNASLEEVLTAFCEAANCSYEEKNNEVLLSF
jgi:ferric-dicitrate binding protein FerR (iron transport regulator)